jgi:hypothetical protein
MAGVVEHLPSKHEALRERETERKGGRERGREGGKGE